MILKKALYINGLPVNRSFCLFLLGQGISGMGDTFQTVAVAIILFKITGSGMWVGFAMVCSIVPSILFSPVAGTLGDKYNTKYLLVILDLLRGVVAILFVVADSAAYIYLLLISLSCLNIFYNPPSKKMFVMLLKENELVAGNSLFSGVVGVTCLAGPLVAGVAITVYGTDIAFIVNGSSFIFSATMLLLIKIKSSRKYGKIIKQSSKGIFGDIKSGINYFTHSRQVKEIVFTCTFICIGTASVNVAFYPFAFDVLKVTSSGWGMILSILYGTNLIAMCTTAFSNKNVGKKIVVLIFSPLLFVAVAWLSYSMIDNILITLFFLGIEGTAMAICGIYLGSSLQGSADVLFTSRIMGINDVLNSLGKIIGIVLAYTLIYFFNMRFVFFANSIILLLFALFKLVTSNSSSYNRNMVSIK
jgi:MFS transporter, DHA3 family, macrolide efflux protein